MKQLKGGKKSNEQRNAIKNVKTKLYKSRVKVIKFFDDCSRIVSEAKYKRKYREGLKILPPKQMLQRLPIALAQVKAGNTFKNLEMKPDKLYILCIKEKKLLKKYIII